MAPKIKKRDVPNPGLRDSDVMYLAIKRLTAVADKMAKLEYDEDLDRLMEEANAFFDWAVYNIASRDKQKRLDVKDDVAAMQERMVSGNPESTPESTKPYPLRHVYIHRPEGDGICRTCGKPASDSIHVDPSPINGGERP